MRFGVVALIYLAGTLLSMTGMAWASALFLWNDIFRPLAFARNDGAYPVAYFVTLVLGAAFVRHWMGGKMKPQGGVFLWAFGVMVGWLLVVTLMSPFKSVAFGNFVTYLKYLCPLLIIYCSTTTLKNLRLIVLSLTGSVATWGAQAGAHCLITGPNIEISIPGGQMEERNDFSCAMVGTIPILLYFALNYAGRFRFMVRMLFFLGAFLNLSGIILSLSRGASLGLGVSAIMYAVYVSKRKMRDTLLLALVLGVGLLMLPQTWWDRMHTIEIGTEQTEGSAKNRVNLMRGAINATKDYPIFGLGPGGWLEVGKDYTGGDDHNPHSIYLVLSSETGIPGLLIYLAVMGLTVFRLSGLMRRAHKSGDVEIARMGAAFIMSIFGLLAAMSFLNRPFNEYLWAWVCLAHALVEIANRRGRLGFSKLQSHPTGHSTRG
jgi:probable O-glycosylation ligase (exosortase A-associated)